jgi:ketosteroid isomerase-like protein
MKENPTMRPAWILALLIAIVPACGTQQELDTTVQAATVRASLDSLWAQYAVAADQRDSIAFGALFFDDATLVFSNAPTVSGRAAIETFLVTRYTGIDVTALRVTPDDLRVHGPLAVETGSFEEDYTEAGAPKTQAGRFVLIAEPDAKKAWKIRRMVSMADSVRTRPPA